MRGLLRSYIDKFKGAFIITNYAVLTNYSQKSKQPVEFLKFLELPRSVHHLPLMITERHDDFYDLNIFKSGGLTTNFYLKFRTQNYSTQQSVKDKEKCKDKADMNSRVLYFDYDVPMVIKMQTCHLTKIQNKNLYTKEKVFLYLINNDYNRTNIEEILSSDDYEEQDFKFFEFDEQGFCMCDYFDFYLNECKVEVLKRRIDGIYICLSFIAGILLFFVIYELLSSFFENNYIIEFLH